MSGYLALVWGSSFFLIAVGLEAFTPGMVAWGRLVVAVVALSLIPAARKRIDRSDLPAITIVAIAGNAGPALLFAYAEQTLESSVAGMLNAAVPLATAGIAFTLGIRSLKRRHVVGLALGLVGVIVLSLPSVSGVGGSPGGVLLVLLAVLGYAITGNVLVPLAQKYGALSVILRAQLIGVVAVTPFALVDFSSNRLSLWPVLAVVVLGALGTGVARAVQATMNGRVGAPRAAIIGYLVPIVAIILGVAFRNETLELLELIGLVAVLISAYLVTRAVRSAPVEQF